MFPVLRAALAWAALVVVAVAAAGQEQTGASRFALAIVADPKGKAIVDVGVDDIVVTEAGAARDILDVRVADYPVAIVIDNGRDARADFPAIRAAVARFIERTGPRPLAIVSTAPPTMIATLEDEPGTLAEKLETIAEPGDAAGQPLRAAAMAATAINQTGALFSTIVVVTASPTEVAGTAADELLAPIIDSRAVVHVVANDRTASGAAAPLLRNLVQQTHGNYTAIYAAPSYQPAIDRLVARLTTELMIEYLVPVGSRALDVKIGVRVPGARVRGLGVAPR